MQWALAEGKSLEIVGHDATLDMSAIAGITLYEPEELVLSAKAGTPRAEIEALLAKNGQELAFEPATFWPWDHHGWLAR